MTEQTEQGYGSSDGYGADLGSLAATTAGSRTFAGTFVVEWTPSQTAASLVIKVTAGGSLLTQGTFNTDNATQHLSGDNGTYFFKGTFVAGFNAPPTSGTLFGQNLEFTAPGDNKTRFSGVLGVW